MKNTMKKIISLLAAIMLVLLFATAGSRDVKAETVYVVNAGTVYTTTTENPFYYYSGDYPATYYPYWGYQNYPAGFYPNLTQEQWIAYCKKAGIDYRYAVVPGWNPYVWGSPAAPPVAPVCAPSVTTYNPYYANQPYNVLPYCYQ